MLKSHPLFGVGFGNFADYSDHTAHNSIVVCAAELGLVRVVLLVSVLVPHSKRRFGDCFAERR